MLKVCFWFNSRLFKWLSSFQIIHGMWTKKQKKLQKDMNIKILLGNPWFWTLLTWSYSQTSDIQQDNLGNREISNLNDMGHVVRWTLIVFVQINFEYTTLIFEFSWNLNANSRIVLSIALLICITKVVLVSWCSDWHLWQTRSVRSSFSILDEWVRTE